MHAGWCKSALGAVAAFILVVATSPAAIAQWPSYPTAGVPRSADGRVDSERAGTAYVRRQTGPVGCLELRRRARLPRRATPAAARHAARGDVLEHRSRNQGRSALPAVGRRAPQAAHGRQQQGQPGRGVPPARLHAAAHALAAAQADSDQGSDRHPLRGQRRHPPDLPRRTARRRTTIPSRGGSATPGDPGKATRWSSRAPISGMMAGST